MRCSFSSVIILLVACGSSHGQSQNTSAFQARAQTAVSGGKLFNGVSLTANAEWIAGALHQTGTAQLQAKTDGSANIQLDLGESSRSETQTKIDVDRNCTWTDRSGSSHSIVGPNCFIAVPWFAPILFTQPISTLPNLIRTTDDGEVQKGDSTFHQVRFWLNLQGEDSASTTQMVNQSTVVVLYDLKTSLPTSLEYSVHPDSNDLEDIPVQIVFSSYQTVSGVLLPFHMEKYVNRTLQLTLDLTNASIE